MKRPMISLPMALLVVAAIFVLTLMGAGYQDCTEKGGTYVRGVLWFQCIEADR